MTHARNKELKSNLRELNAIQPAPLSDFVLRNLFDIEIEMGWKIEKHNCEVTRETVPYSLIVGHEFTMVSAISWGELLDGHSNSRMPDYLKRLEESQKYFCDDNWPKDAGVWLAKLDGKYYLAGGKHRVTINYFLRHFNSEFFSDSIVLPNVKVLHYKLL